MKLQDLVTRITSLFHAASIVYHDVHDYRYFGRFGEEIQFCVDKEQKILKRTRYLIIEVFRIIKSAKTSLLLFCKAASVKAQQMGMKPV